MEFNLSSIAAANEAVKKESSTIKEGPHFMLQELRKFSDKIHRFWLIYCLGIAALAQKAILPPPPSKWMRV